MSNESATRLRATGRNQPCPYNSVASVAAILLAAGRSRRMGAFKPLLPFGAQTVVETCVENLRAAGVDEIVIVVGYRAEDVRAQLARWPVKFALNDEAASEMGVSVARGVEQISEEATATLIALVDQPAVPAETIREIAGEHLLNGARLVVPTWQGRGGHPVLVSLDFRDELRRLDPQRGLRALFERYRDEVRRVPAASPYVVRDMDTWEDYRSLHEDVLGELPPSIAEINQPV